MLAVDVHECKNKKRETYLMDDGHRWWWWMQMVVDADGDRQMTG